MEADELDLVRAAAGGDDGAFHALIDRHAPDLMRVAVSLSHRREDAEDLLQETFIGAYRGIRNFQGRSSLRTWLVQILTRQAAKSWHRNRHHRKAMSIHKSEESGGGERTDLPGSDASVRSIEQRIDLNQILSGMPDAFREILVLREVRGLSYDEIAETLQVPRGTVESRLSRARADFRERMSSGTKSKVDV